MGYMSISLALLHPRTLNCQWLSSGFSACPVRHAFKLRFDFCNFASEAEFEFRRYLRRGVPARDSMSTMLYHLHRDSSECLLPSSLQVTIESLTASLDL